jgi:hypothetical protein
MVSGIVAGIAIVSAAVCMALLYIMLRMWSNWREVSVSSSDGEEPPVHGKGSKCGAGDGKYWKVGSGSVVTSEEKYSSASESSILHGKSTEASAMNLKG